MKLVAVSGIAAITIIGGLTACKSTTPAAVSSAPAVSTSAPAAPAAPADTTASAMSAAEQQAVDSAQSYLALGQGFSKAGLLQQLTSSYGAGFTQAQAEYAVSKVGL